MSATMARQGGQVQLEQSDMRRALNVAKMAKEGVLHATIEEMQYLMKQPVAKVRNEKKWGVEVPGHEDVKAAMKKHLAMVCGNQMDGCIPYQMGQHRIRRHAGGVKAQLYLDPIYSDSQHFNLRHVRL